MEDKRDAITRRQREQIDDLAQSEAMRRIVQAIYADPVGTTHMATGRANVDVIAQRTRLPIGEVLSALATARRRC